MMQMQMQMVPRHLSLSPWWVRSTFGGGDSKRADGQPGRRLFDFAGGARRYDQFEPMYSAPLFNATEWAELFAASGARYMRPVVKFGDGWTHWPSNTTGDWGSASSGPRRDVVGELFDAARSVGYVPLGKVGDGRFRLMCVLTSLHPSFSNASASSAPCSALVRLRTGVHFELAEWLDPATLKRVLPPWRADALYAVDPVRYRDTVAWTQLTQLVETYRPDDVYTDSEWDWDADWWRSREWLAWLFNESPVRDHVVVNDRWGNETRGHHGSYFVCEYEYHCMPN